MGLFGSKKTEAEVAAVVPEKEPSVQEGTVIGQGITFVGTFTADELIDIRGKVEGEIVSPKEVLVSKTGKHEGIMDVEYLTVDGTIDSEIHCRNTVTLRDDCQVFGTVETPRLDAQHGSNFHGELILEKDLLKKMEAKEAEDAVEAEDVAEDNKLETEAAEEVIEVKEFEDLVGEISEESKPAEAKAEEPLEPEKPAEKEDSKEELVEFIE